jgi:hypothetical protein
MSEIKSTADEVARIFGSLDEDAQKVLTVVIQIEHAHLHLGRPHGIASELQSAIEKVIQ